MQLGMIGLGRMGANMVRRLMRGGHELVVWDVNPDAVDELAGEGATGAHSLEELVRMLDTPRPVWLMLPVAFVDRTIEKLVAQLDRDDIVGMSGGWSKEFFLPVADVVKVTLRYRMLMPEAYEPDECGEVLVSVDDALIGPEGTESVATLCGQPSDQDTLWQWASAEVGLPSHEITPCCHGHGPLLRPLHSTAATGSRAPGPPCGTWRT